jgi:hypothetical protein
VAFFKSHLQGFFFCLFPSLFPPLSIFPWFMLVLSVFGNLSMHWALAVLAGVLLENLHLFEFCSMKVKVQAHRL